MRRNTIACDIDLTVVDSLTPWLKWFKDLTGREVLNKEGRYDLVPEMKHIVAEEGLNFDPYSFWEKEDLYDNMFPVEGSLSKLQEYYDCGWDVVFVSLCNPYHTKSKIAFIERHFPFNSGFISTEQKEYVCYDIMVDDKKSHIDFGMKRNPHAKHYLMSQVSRGYVIYDDIDKYNVIDHWDSFPSPKSI